MGVGDLSFAAVASLVSIDKWTATINSNMAGAGRVGYKASRIKFGGGTISTARPTVSPLLGVNFAEQSLGTMQTSVDFSQGAITASTDFTHLGIQRTSASPGMFTLNTAFDGSGDYYYTFDGEFHMDASGRLVNSDGLYVMSTDLDALGVDAGDIINDQISLDRLGLTVWPNPQLELEFSRYGATTFQRVGFATNVPPPVANRAVIDAVGNYTNIGGSGRVIPNALEASNASLTASVPELALAQKMYSAIAKVIQVALANIDTALALGPR
jgi:flagellar hook protein FlgE